MFTLFERMLGRPAILRVPGSGKARAQAGGWKGGRFHARAD
jgi:hypothetical protein